MTITQKINQFIETLSFEEENLFPYLHNQNYVKGESNVYYSGPYWDNQEIEAAITNLFTGKWLASGESIVLCLEKDEAIKFAEQQQCISPYTIDNTN